MVMCIEVALVHFVHFESPKAEEENLILKIVPLQALSGGHCSRPIDTEY